MTIHAFKYQGAGNDFVILDNRSGEYDSLTKEQINRLCDRRFGVGSDGLMLFGKSEKYDFSMRYFNSDGGEGTMCGNGGRCMVAFAYHRGLKKFEFEAIDGYHKAELLEASPKGCTVKLKMIDVAECKEFTEASLEHGKAYILDTGSFHYVEFVKDVDKYPVFEKGRFWRYHFEGGINVNFVEPAPNGLLKIRTYERGVEAETFACGTGATASAIAAYVAGIKRNRYALQALGGRLQVEFVARPEGSFSDIYLTGPATFVYSCNIDI